MRDSPTIPVQSADRPDRNPEIERARAADLAMLALDRRGGVPQHLGAVLLFDAQPARSAEQIRRVIVERIPAVPRLRRRLVRPPLGCGAQIWVDDPGFDPARHVRVRHCPAPGDEPALLDLAASVMTEPLSRAHPPWAAVVVPGLAAGHLAVVLVLHHVLADGLGGLAILSRLVDGVPVGPVPAFPRSAPRPRELAADAVRSRLRAVGRLGAACRESRRSMTAAGGLFPPRAAPCSLLAPTGPRRRFATARADLEALRRAAHSHGASVNDVLLAALSGALHDLLAGRGEQLDALRIAVMVTGRRDASADAPGNRVAPLLVTVPATGTAVERLQRTAGVVGAARATAAAQPPIAMLQPLFRLIAAAGLYRRYMNRQRRLHLLVSNVPGPREPVALGGVPVTAAVPLGVGEAGNLTVTALALSYAGTLTVTIIVDPDRVPELDLLARSLQAELDGFTRPPGPGAAGPPAAAAPARAVRAGTRTLGPRRTNALPPALGRRVNAAVERLAALGLTPANTVSLEVPGRRTGLLRRTAVVVARHAGRDYLVSLAGESEWVGNLRAAGGRAVIRHGQARPVRLTEVAAGDRAPVLQAFLGRRALTRSPARSARIYFGLPAHPSIEQLAPLAGRYPVFEIGDGRDPAVDGAAHVQSGEPS